MALSNSTLPYRIVFTSTVCNATQNIRENILVNRLGVPSVTNVLGVTAQDRELPNPADAFPIPLQSCFLVVSHGEYAVQFDTLTSYGLMAIGTAVTGLAGKLSAEVGNAPVILEGGETPRLISKAVGFDGIGYGLISLR